ncbi:MAG: transposase, partial [Desulfocapsa sp.]|nr:transposase [Desulfocapsa sp.]
METPIRLVTAWYNKGTQQKKCKYLILSFPYSNHYYYQLFKGENQESFLTGLQNIFDHMGAVPSRILFDNLSAAVTMRKGTRTKSTGFLKFEMHYKFAAEFCNVNAGNEKGNVENKVGYHRRNFMVPVPEISDFKAYNEAAFLKSENDMNRMHYKKERLISELYVEDKNAFNSLPENPYDIYRIEKARCNKYGIIHLDSKRYSVSPTYAQKQVWAYIY